MRSSIKSRFVSFLIAAVMLVAMFPVNMCVSAEAGKIAMDNVILPSGTTAVNFNIDGSLSGGWMAVYAKEVTNLKQYIDYVDVKFDGSGVITFPSNQSVRMRYDEWQPNGALADGCYYAVLYGDGSYNNILAQIDFEVKPETSEPEEFPVYYVAYGGTGDGSSEQLPLGSIYDAITKINEDGYGAGDTVTVKISNKGNPQAFTENTFVGFSERANPAHDAVIIYTSADDTSEENWTNLVFRNNNADGSTNFTITGPSVFRNIYLVSQFAGYMKDICVQGHDVCFENVLFRTHDRNTHEFVNRNDPVFCLGGNRNAVGATGDSGFLTVDNGNNAVKIGTINMSSYLGEAGNTYTTIPGDTTVKINGGSGSSVNLLQLFSAGPGYISGVESGVSSYITFEGDVNAVFNNTTVSEFSYSGVKPIVKGAIQVILNNGSSVESNTASAYSSEEKTEDAPLYIITSGIGGSLDITDTAGTYEVLGGKTAYLVTDDGKTVYYGEKIISVPGQGEYSVNYADSVEVIKDTVVPGMQDGMKFDKWIDDGEGKLTASYTESQREYYIKLNGSGDGRSFESPAGSVEEVVRSINSDGHGKESSVTVYVIPSDEPPHSPGDTITLEEFNFLSLNHTVHHEAEIRFTTYNYDQADGSMAVLALNNTFGYMANIGIAIQGPTVFENIKLLDCRTDYRTDINAQGYDLELKNIIRLRTASSSTNPTEATVKVNDKTVVYSASNRNGRGQIGEGGRVIIHDGTEFSELYFGGYTTSDGNDETYENSHTFEINGTSVPKVDLSIAAAGRVLNYKKDVNLVLNGSNVGSFVSTRPVITEGAIQIILNNGSEVSNFSADKNSKISSSGSAAATPVYIMDSGDYPGMLDVTETTGEYLVNAGGAIAYAQKENGKTVYYGSEVLRVNEPGRYMVKYAENKEEIMLNAAVPENIDKYNVFASWIDDGNGTMTAKFEYRIPTYYVSSEGSDANDGLSAESPLATASAAIEKIGAENGVVYCIGNVILADTAHEGKIYYESYNGGTVSGQSNVIKLEGPSVFNADFASSQTILTNGHYLELGGSVDETKGIDITVGNAAGSDEKIVINGKFVRKLVTRIQNQNTGSVDIIVDGGILRQMSTGSGISGDASYTVSDVSVTVKSGEFWCLNHTDNGPHKASGAFEYIANGNSFYFDEARMLLDNYPIKSWVDFTPGGTDGFPKIQFDGGKWIIRSSDEQGNLLEATDIPGRYKITGEKTPYYITENGQTVYYGCGGYITLPTGTIDVLWTADFSSDILPEPQLDFGYEFNGWSDDGSGMITAIVTNPNFYYVDISGSDDNLGTQDAPLKNVSKAIEKLSGKTGYVYIVSDAYYDSSLINEFEGKITIAGLRPDSVISFGESGNMVIKGITKFENITLKGNSPTALIETNGKTFEIGENVIYIGSDSDIRQIITGTESVGGSPSEKVVLSKGNYAVTVGEAEKSSEKTDIILNEASAEISVETVDPNASIRVSAEKSDITKLSVENNIFGTLEIISNGKKLENMPENSSAWYISSETDDESRIDYTETPGVYGIQSSYGKTPIAVSEDGTVYVAGDYSSQDEVPATWYETNDYASYINYRKPLSNTYKKLTSDKELNVVYFGGSVTAGYGSSDANKYSWRALIGQWLIDNFPDANINNINRAVGESGTYLGTYRVQRDVIAHKPDLVFLEYSINDRYYNSGYEKAKYQYETIVREIKQALPNCDIVTILVTDSNCVTANRNGQLHTEAQAHEDMAELYNIPTLHVGRVLADILPGDTADGWSYTDWSKYAIDGVHLNDAGNYVYYQCIREYMYNSLFCTEHTGRTLRHDELIPVYSDALFDGNRTLTQPTAELIAKSELMGGTGFEYLPDFYGVHDYYGIASTSKADAVFAFEFEGTEMALMSNFYTNSYLAVSVDGGEYVTKECSGHSPTRIVENLESGNHIVRLKPVFGTVSGSPTTFNIGAIFTRDASKATIKGTKFEYTDYANYTLTVPSGNYYLKYVSADTVADIPVIVKENQIFNGWKDSGGNDVSMDESIVPGMILVPQYIDVNEYFVFQGVQIRVNNETNDQGLRFIVDKNNAIDDIISVKDFGMVVIPSIIIGDNRSYEDYDPEIENCTSGIIGAEKLYIGSKHEYNGKEYDSGTVIAEKIFDQLENGIRYTTCITNIGEAEYGKYYTLKAFVRYTYNGMEYVAYTDPFCSSIYDVAKAISINDSAQEYEKNIAENIISIVEGN